MKTLYIDLDGTCFWFDKEATLDEILQKGYFSKLSPFGNVIEGVKIFKENNPDINLKILSCCLDRDYIETDKNKLVDKYMPYIARTDRIFIPYGTKKSDYMKDGSFLLDDYTANLQDVTEKGHVGIKLINDINFKKHIWKGHSIYYDFPAWLIADEISRIIKEENK